MLTNVLQRFKELTTGNTIIIGRKTFESLPKGALPNRRNVVLSRNSDFSAPGAEVFHSLDEALQTCKPNEEIFIIGGASLYQEAMGRADRLCLTHIEDTPLEADAFFPEINEQEWQIESDEKHETDEKHRFCYRFTDYVRR